MTQTSHTQTSPAPVALFVYNRLDTARQTIAHLQQNKLAGETELFIFSDGGKDEKSWKQVRLLRETLRRTAGFKKVTLIERPVNIYLERNILEGIASLFETYDRIIVLEDDICTSPYFLTYMNEALEQYYEEEKVMHISGFTNLCLTDKGDTYFTPHMSGWGWATWRHKWKAFKHYTTRNEALQGLTEEDCLRMQYGGSFPCLKSLDKSPIPWDVCWEIAIYRHQGVCLTPARTLVRNIGIYNGTHFHISKWIGRYEYDRPVNGQPVRLPPRTAPVAADPEIESLYPAAFKDWGIRYTLLGKVLRYLYLKWIKSSPDNLVTATHKDTTEVLPPHNLRIALVKQDVYQDLYVCPPAEKNALSILLSSQVRVGPIGLVADLDTDFYIVKEERDAETQLYRYVIPHMTPYLRMLKDHTLDKLPTQEFMCPGSAHTHGEYSITCEEVDWGQYDIVISINVSLPTRVVRRYPHTLFAYMIGEANMATDRARFGYDVTLNQMARGRVVTDMQANNEIDFPYTFLKGDTLQRLMEQYEKRMSNPPGKREGIFMEINSTTERPVTSVPPHFRPLADKGYPILLHRQRIADNLQAVFHSKYFLKMGGRPIRGNSVAEAISLGSLVLMNREEVTHKELIIDECHVTTMDEAVALIGFLEQHPEEYERLRAKQQQVLTELFFERPLLSLHRCLQQKRHEGAAPYPFRRKFADRCYIMKMAVHAQIHLFLRLIKVKKW